MRDVVTAVATFLKADAGVQAFISDGLPSPGYRVFRHELPESEAQSMPRPCIVVRKIPGIGGARGRVELERGVLQITCYGEQPQQAEELRGVVREALKYAQREVIGGTLIHGLDPSTSPNPGRDGEARWPFMDELYEFLASEIEVV